MTRMREEEPASFSQILNGLNKKRKSSQDGSDWVLRLTEPRKSGKFLFVYEALSKIRVMANIKASLKTKRCRIF